MNLIDIESGKLPLLTSLTEQTCCPERVQRIHNKDYHYSTSTREEFLQNIVIENPPIEEGESIHPNGRAMRISGLFQGDSVLTEPSLVATNAFYFIRSTVRTETDIFPDKVILSNNQ